MQPSGWVQVVLGAGLTVLSIAVAFMVTPQWSSLVASVGTVIGLGVILIALYFHLVEKRTQERLRQARALNNAARRNALGNFSLRGQEFAQSLSRGYALERKLPLRLLEEIRQWAEDTEGYLGANFGESHVARFRQEALFPGGTVAADYLTEWWDAYERAVTRRCRNLEGLMTELRD